MGFKTEAMLGLDKICLQARLELGQLLENYITVSQRQIIIMMTFVYYD